jgi:hypothetical protein
LLFRSSAREVYARHTRVRMRATMPPELGGRDEENNNNHDPGCDPPPRTSFRLAVADTSRAAIERLVLKPWSNSTQCLLGQVRRNTTFSTISTDVLVWNIIWCNKPFWSRMPDMEDLPSSRLGVKTDMGMLGEPVCR